MEINLFFDSIHYPWLEEMGDVHSLRHCIKINQGKIKSLKEFDIVMIGLAAMDESQANVSLELEEFRKKLYSLKRGSGAYRILDAGNLRPGPDKEETFKRLEELCVNLLAENVFPLVIGPTQEASLAQMKAYEELEKLVCFLNVDADLDLQDKSSANAGKTFLNEVFLHPFLFHYVHLAYQSYFVSPKDNDLLDKMYFEKYRLGQIRDGFKDIEPVIRQADLLSFDLRSIKSQDAPGQEDAPVFGLTGEEACRIAWYCGASEKLSSAGFFGYVFEKDKQGEKTAFVLATMVWYFFEGFYLRKGGLNFRTNDFVKYVVAMPTKPQELIFYKSLYTEKWWMEVPSLNKENNDNHQVVIPCSYSDYEIAGSGEVPDRYIQHFSKP